MRDIIVTLAVFGLLPLILRRPWLGVLAWSWLGFMNPHRLTWGFAYDHALRPDGRPGDVGRPAGKQGAQAHSLDP